MNNIAQDIAKDYAKTKLNDLFEENKGYLKYFNIDGMKVYFDVTNSYVIHKLKIILFPILLRTDDWKQG